MKKLVLVNLNYEDNPLKGGCNLFLPNVGIESLYTNLKKTMEDLDIEVVDGMLHNLDNEQIKEEILKFEPKVVGFSTTYVNLEDALQISKELKKESLKIITVIGGVGAKSLRALSKEENIDDIDYCVVGDGERVLKEIMKNGKVNSKMIHKEDTILNLDSLDFPRRNGLETEEYMRLSQKISYLNRNERYLSIYTSKGCDWGKCVHCTVDNNYRVRSLSKVKEEIDYLVSNYKVSKLFIFDDNLFSADNPERIYGLCDIFGEFPHLKWEAETRVMDFTADIELSKQLLKRMKESGCTEISWGIESLDNRILKILRKGIALCDIETAIELATKGGITSKLYLMYNMPGETRESLNNTLNSLSSILQKHRVNFLKFSEYSNIPGSIGWYLGLEQGNVPINDLKEFENKVEDLCTTNQVGFGFYNWERKKSD